MLKRNNPPHKKYLNLIQNRREKMLKETDPLHKKDFNLIQNRRFIMLKGTEPSHKKLLLDPKQKRKC